MPKRRTENRKKGDAAERRAIWYLRFHGYRILERNYVFGHKEIDIIAQKRDIVAFVEVKARTSCRLARPYLAVNKSKRHNIIVAAKIYALSNDLTRKRIRFDIAEVDLSARKINYIKNAYTDAYSFN